MAVTKRTVYLPKWQRYVIVPLLVGLWLFISYDRFLGSNAENIGTTEYAVMTLVFLGAALMLWLMTGGTLPAYVIREERDDASSDTV